MNRRRIGLREVRALQPGEIIWDDKAIGFGARRQKSEAVTYVLVYRTKDGRQRWYRIGRHGSPLTPEMARDKAKELLGEVAKGGDPAKDKETHRKTKTIAELCDAYLADAKAGRVLTKGQAKRASTLALDQLRIERHIKPHLGFASRALPVQTACATVREMKEGPSRSAIRCWSQATASCCRQKRWW